MSPEDNDARRTRGRADRIPRLTAEIATILEDEERGRVGIEISIHGAPAAR